MKRLDFIIFLLLIHNFDSSSITAVLELLYVQNITFIVVPSISPFCLQTCKSGSFG